MLASSNQTFQCLWIINTHLDGNWTHNIIKKKHVWKACSGLPTKSHARFCTTNRLAYSYWTSQDSTACIRRVNSIENNAEEDRLDLKNLLWRGYHSNRRRLSRRSHRTRNLLASANIKLLQRWKSTSRLTFRTRTQHAQLGPCLLYTSRCV